MPTCLSDRVHIRRAVAWICVTLLAFLAVSTFILLVESGGAVAALTPDRYMARRMIALLALIAALGYALTFHFDRTVDTLFAYRWPIAVVLFALCVIFEISGSSFNVMHGLLGEAPDRTLFGVARDIRSDEYLVNTPQAFSQYWNHFGWFSSIVRAAPTDMFIVYGQPVLDPAVVFRPFHWGYLLFGMARGLAFFWSGRLIFLFMVSLEFGYRLLTPRSRSLALGYALLVAFPVRCSGGLP